MDIEILKEFVDLALEQNFSSAARELHISQSTLSRHINALERELGRELITRTVPISLTPAGRRVFEGAATIIESYNDMLRDLKGLGSLPDRDVIVQKMSHWPNANESVRCAVLEVQKTNPGFSAVQMPPSPSKNTAQMINEGGFDICFDLAYDGLIDETYLERNGLEARIIKRAWRTMGIVVRNDNPLLKRKSIALKDFKDVRFIVQGTKSHEKCLQSFAFFCERVAGFTPRMDLKLIADYQQFYLIDPKDNAFIGLAPDILPPQTKDHYTIVYPDNSSHVVDAVALYRANLPKDGPIRRFLSALVTQLESSEA